MDLIRSQALVGLKSRLHRHRCQYSWVFYHHRYLLEHSVHLVGLYHRLFHLHLSIHLRHRHHLHSWQADPDLYQEGYLKHPVGQNHILFQVDRTIHLRRHQDLYSLELHLRQYLVVYCLHQVDYYHTQLQSHQRSRHYHHLGRTHHQYHQNRYQAGLGWQHKDLSLIHI